MPGKFDIVINCTKCEDNHVIGFLSDYLDSEEIRQLDTYDFKRPLPQRLKDDIRKHEREHFQQEIKKQQELEKAEKVSKNLGKIQDIINDFSVHKWEVLHHHD